MALDQKYFDDINIDVVKKKYYNANKVNAVLRIFASRRCVWKKKTGTCASS